MSEIATCPICQAMLILEEDGSKYGCFDCYFGCNPEDLPRITAAMELAKATRTLEKACEMRALEVFK